MNWEILKSQTEDFKERLKLALNELGIYENCKGLSMDHVCVRLSDDEDVVSLKQELVEVLKFHVH